LRFLDTESNSKSLKDKNYGFIKYNRGDEVKVTIYSEVPEFWYKGKVLDVNARYIIPSIESSWKVEYYVSFRNKNGSELKYWFLESELRKYDLLEERNSIIEQLLN
jgi:hypothetical protein